MNILMVCLGNICRSPLAEGILQQKAEAAGLNWTVDSAGTNGLHDGEPPHRLSQRVAAQNNIDISRQRSRTFRAADLDRFDVIYAMAGDVMEEIRRVAGPRYDPSRIRLFGDINHPGEALDVPDPWYGGEAGYHEVFRLLEEGCTTLVKPPVAE